MFKKILLRCAWKYLQNEVVKKDLLLGDQGNLVLSRRQGEELSTFELVLYMIGMILFMGSTLLSFPYILDNFSAEGGIPLFLGQLIVLTWWAGRGDEVVVKLIHPQVVKVLTWENEGKVLKYKQSLPPEPVPEDIL